jgi:hypothetical protein
MSLAQPVVWEVQSFTQPTQVQVLSRLEFGFLIKNHLVPPKLDLVFYMYLSFSNSGKQRGNQTLIPSLMSVHWGFQRGENL